MKHADRGCGLRTFAYHNASELVVKIASKVDVKNKKHSKITADGKHRRTSASKFDEETIAHARWLLEKGHCNFKQVADWLNVDHNYVRSAIYDYGLMVMVLPRQSLRPHLLPRER